MSLKSLQIKGFRNLKDVDLSFDPQTPLTVFLGQNGQGKTNLLEAIFTASLGKSFRARELAELVGWDEDFAQVSAAVQAARPLVLDVIVTRNPLQKTLKVNGVKQKAFEFIGHMPVVFFSPEELSELADAPTWRRRYLDLLLSQLDRAYLQNLMAYHHAVKQRNALLRQIRDGNNKPHDLDFWDEKLAALGLSLITERRAVLQKLQPLVQTFYNAIAHQEGELMLGYIVSAEPEQLPETLAKNRKRDLQLGATTVGPHRDDLQFLLNGEDMTRFASRGEWRTLVLALKLAERELFQKTLGTEPVLLLDDVFSELDEERQKYLIQSLGGAQAFITTTHEEFLRDVQTPKVVYEVKEGSAS